MALPATISVAVLPNAPHAREMATKAHNQGHEVLYPPANGAAQQTAAGKRHPASRNEQRGDRAHYSRGLRQSPLRRRAE
ncbi:divergent polysaccharide deacetylase family protein [Klebsiella pneumoniae subsp. pneumoniae]|nr:divergent polysaccharide deacetylase family protein [Klebsiella pneumoniae subsp. pneumoniae]